MGHEQGSYEEYVHEHELLPKWAKFVGDTLSPKPSDSKLKTAGRFLGLLTSPLWVPVPTLAAHAHDELGYNPLSGTLAVPGYAAYKVNQALSKRFGSVGTTAARPPLPPKLTFPSSIYPPTPRRIVLPPVIPKVTTPPKAYRPPAPPRSLGPPPRTILNNLRIADPSWKLKLAPAFTAKPSWSMPINKLVLPKLGASLPFRPYAQNIGLTGGTLRLNKF